MKYLYTALMLIACISLTAQTTLPTSWDFVSSPATLPTGWSTNTTANYSSGMSDLSGGTSVAGKLQATDHEFTIHFFDEPGTVSYYMKSYGTNSFMGTFEVQESVAGTSWSTITSYTNNGFNDQWTQFTSTPNTSSRYIRFILTNKISGTNVGLDNVTIAANIPTAQEINVTYGGNDVPSGTGIQFASAVGTPLNLNFDVENLGTASALSINGATLTGAAAGDYTVTTTPTSVGTQSSESLVVSFNPTANGSRVATLSIANDDANENPYTIVLNGIGGTGASEPTDNPVSFTTPVLKTYRFKVDFPAVSADGYLAMFRKGQNFSATPVDGTIYESGQSIGDAKVIYIGSNNSFYIHESEANTKYFVKVFAFNGNGQFVNFKSDNPLEAEIITPIATMADANYYNGVNETASSFLGDLQDVVNPHMIRFYSNYDEDFVTGFYQRDTTNGRKALTCVYSSEDVTFIPPFNWSNANMNREHTLPSSWMPTTGSSNTPEYQDYHHLFPTIAQPNSQRSNNPFGNVVNVTNSYGDGVVGTNSQGNTVYEPRDAQKGDAARAIFYMQATYDGIDGNSWALDDLNSQGASQKQEVLKEWHTFDLPNGHDIARNDFLDSLQQNRNPFADSAHWVCFIDFKTMSYISSPDSGCLAATMAQPPVDTTDSTISIKKVDFDTKWRLYPNPATDFVTVGHTAYEQINIKVVNLNGTVVLEKNNSGTEQLDLRNLAQGLYFLRLSDTRSGASHTFKLTKL